MKYRDYKGEEVLPERDWKATCPECGCKKMSYYNFKYLCPKCNYLLEV